MRGIAHLNRIYIILMNLVVCLCEMTTVIHVFRTVPVENHYVGPILGQTEYLETTIEKNLHSNTKNRILISTKIISTWRNASYCLSSSTRMSHLRPNELFELLVKFTLFPSLPVSFLHAELKLSSLLLSSHVYEVLFFKNLHCEQ